MEGIDDIATTIGEHVSDLIVVFRADGTLQDLNPAGRRLLRIERTTPAVAIADIAAPAERDRLVSILEIVAADGAWSGPIDMTSPVTGDFPTRSTLCRLVLADGTTGTAWVAKDTTTDRDVIKTLRERAFYDPLTGLPHRSLFLDRLDLLLRRTGAAAPSVGVLFVSPDRFKARTHRFEHDVSDEVIKTIAQRIPDVLTGGRSLHRWSDEDFVVLCEAIDDEAEALEIAEAVASAFADPFVAEGRDVFLTASIGVAAGRPGSGTADALLRQAEDAAQSAQDGGGNRVQVFDGRLRAIGERKAAIESALRTAIARDELAVHYQPEVSLRTGQIVACEALLRWTHPALGTVSPGEFVPVAEAANLIPAIGEWVLCRALEQATEWAARFPERPPVMVAINISALQFADPRFAQRVDALLTSVGADPATICLEITESALLDDAHETVDKLVDLKRLGVTLAIDDFGTGYSSLSYLRRFPIDVLKVDQAFVNGLGRDREDSAIVQAVIHMGQALGMKTVAEGVETDHHVIELRELECDLAQGYLYARPMPATEFAALLAKGDDWR